MITVGSLFSGIGGLDLGLEQAGMRTVWQVEFDDWARSKLEENFPHTEKFKDVREVGKHNLRPVDLICGGFPCQDISTSGKGIGLAGSRSGLWFEMFRIISELRPRFVLVENVAALAFRGLDRVIADLSSLRYDAEWCPLRASFAGQPIHRERLFVIAVANGIGSDEPAIFTRSEYQAFAQRRTTYARQYLATVGRYFVGIPEHLRLDDGLSFELSEIEAAVKGYGNAVCPPVAKWIGERIIEFDHNRPPETQDSRLDGGISND